MAGEHSTQDLNGRYAALQNDPIYLRLMAKYQQTHSALDGQNVSNYVMNHPGAAGAGLNFGPTAGQGNHGYSFDPNAGFTEHHDPWWGPDKLAMLLGIAGGGYLAAPYLAGAGASGAAGGAADVSVGSTIPGAASGVGVGTGLLGPSAETAADLAYAGGTGGVGAGLLGPSAETARDLKDVGGGGNGFHLPDGAGGKILQAITALGGAAAGRALSNQSGSGNVPPELQQMLALALSRAKSQQPLFDASNRGMYDMLPNFARTGGG